MTDRDQFTTRAADTTAVEESPAAKGDPRTFAIESARLLADSHCEDIVIFDVSAMSPVTQFILIASGTSDRQIKSLAGHVSELGRETGFPRFGSERDELSTWLALDYVEVMVHLFEPATRAHYDLELMWGDAPRVSWHRG